jgi:hypothetical protein
MATTIDDIASSDPQRPWISIPRDDDDLTKGFIDITFKQLSNGINHATAWLESCLGPLRAALTPLPMKALTMHERIS